MIDLHQLSVEVFSFLGAPARLFGRTLLFTRFFWNGFGNLQAHHCYAQTRYGKHYRWRPWLLFDIAELKMVEDLINNDEDQKIITFHHSQLQAFHMIAIIGALVAQAAITALQLNKMEEVHYATRGFLIASLVLSLLAIFFTCLQQRTYGFIENPAAIRVWLSNGTKYENFEERYMYQSSMLSHQLLQAPFELLCISITLFLCAVGVYTGSAMTRQVSLGSGGSPNVTNQGAFGSFIAATTFSLCMFGQILGGKDVEMQRCFDVFHRHDFVKLRPPNEPSKMEALKRGLEASSQSSQKDPSSEDIFRTSSSEVIQRLKEASIALKNCAETLSK